ncbi:MULTISPECIES: hypothetical protein [unclassified Bradyrhizobium]
MLSRLISLLSRIPAVKWAFNRLRPLPHGSSIDAARSAADEQPAVAAEATPARDTISAEPPCVADLEAGTSEVGEHSAVAVIAVIADGPSEAPAGVSVAEDSSAEVPAVIEAVVDEAPVLSAAIEVVDADEPVSSDPPAELPAEVEPVLAEQVLNTPVEMEETPFEASDLVTDDEPLSTVAVEIEPDAFEETSLVADDIDGSEMAAPVVIEASIDSEPAPGVAAEIEPVVSNDLPLIAAENAAAGAPDVVMHGEPEPAPALPTPKTSSAPKGRAKIVEPADRAALIRQRWTETGIRMWNPRLHGTGEATLNIQGRIGLLPPEPGESMPRYDKLEFRMLGGQIVCEGVIVEAPVHAGQRSFTRLAEPRGTDRTREPVRERQAALA